MKQRLVTAAIMQFEAQKLEAVKLVKRIAEAEECIRTLQEF